LPPQHEDKAMSESEHFRKQAAVQRAQAAETALVLVRDRCERAALAWDAMAERAEKSQRLRIGRAS
jgi:hypothetical protein